MRQRKRNREREREGKCEKENKAGKKQKRQINSIRLGSRIYGADKMIKKKWPNGREMETFWRQSVAWAVGNIGITRKWPAT